MKNTPFISVIMPVHNGGEFLKDAIDSILSQTWKDIELIIIDDGSTDTSADIIKSYRDDRIKSIRQTNHGLAYTLNKGLGLAKGDFIARMDQDDISLPSRLEKQMQYMAYNTKLGVLGTFFTYMDEQGSSLQTTITSPTKPLDVQRSLYTVNPLGHGTVMIRKAAWQEAGGYNDDYEPAGDYELWCRIAEKWELGVLPESLYWYRINPKGISASNNDRQHEMAHKISEEQWSKPFLFKPYKDIVADALYYRNLSPLFGQSTYNQYISEQVSIANGLLARREHIITGAKTMLAAMKFDRTVRKRGIWLIFTSSFHLQPRVIARGLVRRLGFRT